MDATSITFSFFLIFTGAAVFASLALATRQPLIIAYIAQGAFIGPYGLSLVTDTRLLADIGHQQNLAVKKQIHSDPFHVLALLLPLTQKEQTAKLKVYYPKKHKAAAKDGFQISILLNMSHLGEIRTDLFLLNKDLTVTFFVNEDATKKILEKHYSEIKTSLQPWFDYIIIRSVTSKKKIKEFHREDWNISNDKRVNVRI